ncbi:MAG: hypothetical protein Q8M94_01435, partial [Ignavibacteria bacterium]|nr:hypothetical protein [Ignavibacteria bacterium]
ITKDNIPLLQILDSIRYIKKIPDASIESACNRLLAIIKDLSIENKTTLVKLALKYPPAARALLGAILDKAGSVNLTEPLIKSLNPISTYKFYGVGKILNDKSVKSKNNSSGGTITGKWNIK